MNYDTDGEKNVNFSLSLSLSNRYHKLRHRRGEERHLCYVYTYYIFILYIFMSCIHVYTDIMNYDTDGEKNVNFSAFDALIRKALSSHSHLSSLISHLSSLISHLTCPFLPYLHTLFLFCLICTHSSFSAVYAHTRPFLPYMHTLVLFCRICTHSSFFAVYAHTRPFLSYMYTLVLFCLIYIHVYMHICISLHIYIGIYIYINIYICPLYGYI